MDIVLIPGAIATSSFWHNQERCLQENMHVHHAANLSGQSIRDMANKLINTLPPTFTLVGFSLGGYVALELIQQIPDRIEKLVLINSGAKPISDKGLRERERSLELINHGKFDFLINLIFKNSIHSEDNYRALQPSLKAMAQEVGAERYVQQLEAILNKPDHSMLLKTIRCPTLLIASREDNIVPTERSEHMAAHIKNSRLVYIENCGHLAPLEQPNTINHILSNWL